MARATRPVSWLRSAQRDFKKFPESAQTICLNALTIAADGGKADIARPMKGLGAGVFEIALPHHGDAKEGAIMTDEPIEIVRGSGNVFRDLGKDNADVRQLKALLAAEIIKRLDEDGLSVRRAQARTRVPAADFSRIRNADLGRFTSDRLIGILNKLGTQVRVDLKLRHQPVKRLVSA